MTRLLIAVAGLGIVVLSAVGNAVMVDRWGLTGEPQGSVDRLAGVSYKLANGDWVGTDEESNHKHLQIAGAEGHVIRKYTHYTGKSVQVVLLCGKSRPISLHDPKTCYGGAGYVMGTRTQEIVEHGGGGTKAEFFRATFEDEKVVRNKLLMYWAWAPGGKDATGSWTAAVQARSEFRREHALYKLYVLRDISLGEGTADKDACREFLEVFLPELQKRLFTKA